MEVKAMMLDEVADQKPDEATAKLYFVRLNNSEKIQHMVFLVCFVVLAITGFMLKVPEGIVETLGQGRETVSFMRSILHRTAGITMMAVSLYHVYYLIGKSAGRRWLVDMIPRPKDAKDMIFNLLYYIGVKKEQPEFDRFSYKHKLEYGALIAGTTLMSVTGLILWTETRWSKFILDISSLIHGMEAILACLAIMIWHMYEVHIKPHKFPLDNMWLTGVIDEQEMKEEYPLHYKKIMENPDLQDIYIRKESV